MIYRLDGKYYTYEQLKKGYKAITGLNNANDLTEDEMFNYLKNALHEEDIKDLERLDNETFSRYPKATEYVVENLQYKIACNRCKNYVLKTELEDNYAYQCMHCDEDLYSIETETIDNLPSEDDLIDLVEWTNEILCLDEETEDK